MSKRNSSSFSSVNQPKRWNRVDCPNSAFIAVACDLAECIWFCKVHNCCGIQCLIRSHCGS